MIETKWNYQSTNNKKLILDQNETKLLFHKHIMNIRPTCCQHNPTKLTQTS